jgi:hypothetical protein
MKKSLAASTAPASDDAGAAADEEGEPVSTPQMEARHDEASGSK